MKGFIIVGLLLATVGLMVACQSAEQVEFNRNYSAGSAVYQTHCQNCHGDKGQGLAALIPPLTDNKYLTENIHQLPCYLQHGLNGKIKVNGIEFEGKMLPANLSPIEVVQVLTYVTNSFGNKNASINSDGVDKDLMGCR